MIATAEVSALLLAAGRSRRFGQADKLMAPVQGKPLALHVADTLAGMGLSRLVVVCAADAPLAPLLAERGFDIVFNADPDAGQSRSIALGVERLGACPTLICLADMPFVTAVHLRTLMDVFDDAAAPLVASALAGVAMPPALFSASHYHRLRELQGDKGARDLLSAALLVPASADVLSDFDTPEAFE